MKEVYDEDKNIERLRSAKGKISILTAALLFVSLGATQLFAADYTIRAALAHAPSSSWVQAMQVFAKGAWTDEWRPY